MHLNRSNFALQLVIIILTGLLVSYFAMYQYVFEYRSILPDNDYWDLAKFITPSGFEFNWSNLFYKSNEHIIVFPHIIYHINFLLFDGSNLGLQGFGFAFSFICYLCIIYLTPLELKNNALKLLLLSTFCSAIIYFSEVAHNIFMGFSGVIWFSANMFFLLSLVCGKKYHESKSEKFLWVGVTFSVIASICYTTGIFASLLFAIYLVFIKAPKKFSIISFVYFIAFLTFYLATYSIPEANGYLRPADHPELEFSFGKVFLFISFFLGKYFGLYREINLSLFFVILAILMLGFFKMLKSPKVHGQMLPLFIICGYSFIAALMSAVGRSGLGLEMAFSSRYSNLTSLFVISSFAILLFMTTKSKSVSKGILQGLIIVAIISMAYKFSYSETLSYHVQREKEKLLSENLLKKGVFTEEVINKFTFMGSYIIERLPYYMSAGHVPFNR